MEPLQILLSKTLVIVAHPDDEAVGCGALLQRMRQAVVVFATDGAPRDRYFWQAYGSREKYAEQRRQEAKEAAQVTGSHPVFLNPASGCIADQELYLHLGEAYTALRILALELKPTALLTLAYEGGHPDHDCCSILTAALASELNLPAWEMPLYQRGSGEFHRQQFLSTLGTEVPLKLTAEEFDRKKKVFEAHRSQAHVMAEFDPATEMVRPMSTYDYSRPPHAGTLNYEAWGWSVRGTELCKRAMEFRKNVQTRALTVGEKL